MSNNHKKHTFLVKPSLSGSCPPINSLVLAGGLSTRMGMDKSMIQYHGVPQVDHVAHILSRFSEKVFVSTSLKEVQTSFELIQDTFLDLGPYGGVLSAFRFNPNVAWLTVPVDMPLIDEDIMSQLISQRDTSKVATCFLDPATGFPEPLLTIWEPRAYPLLLQNLSQGISCLRETLINSDAKVLTTSTPEKLRNANRVEEMKEIEALIKAKE